MGLTILPIRTKSIENVKNCVAGKCDLNSKKSQDVQKRSVLAYPDEYFLMPPSLGAPLVPEKSIQTIH